MSMFSRQSVKGNIFAMLFAAVGMTGVLGVVGMQTVSGPITTITKVTQKNIVDTDLMTNARVVILNAGIQAAGGDSDSDNYVEPAAFSTSCGGTNPSGGGCLPADIGAVLTDPWGTAYGYCVWDHGLTNTSTNRLQGANSTSEAVIAVISAGRDKTFQTSCEPFDGSAPEGLVEVTTSDDSVRVYTYDTAVAGANGLWSIKAGEPDTAEIVKDLEIGTFNDITGTGFAFDIGTGVGKFPSITTDVLATWTGDSVQVSGGLRLDDEGSVTVCDAGESGVIRWNTGGALQVCDGTAFVDLQTNSAQIIDADLDTWIRVAADDASDNDIIRFATVNNVRASIGATGVFDVVGDADIGATLDVAGNVTLGDALADTVNVAGDLSVDQDAVIDRDVTVSRDATVANDLVVDTDTLFVDASANAVGINDATPTASLDVTGNANITTTLNVGTSAVIGTTANVGTNLTVGGNSALGDATGDLTTVFEDISIGRDAIVTRNLDVDGNATIGDDVADTVTIAGITTIGATLDVAETVKLGSGTCSTGAHAGKIQYTAGNNIQYCNGTSWQAITGNTPRVRDIGNVDIVADPTDGYILQWNDTDKDWKAINPTGITVGGSGSADESTQLIDGDGNDDDTWVRVATDLGADNDTIRFATDGTEWMQIQSDGNIVIDTDTLVVDATNDAVGMGVTAPKSMLHIDGDLLLTNSATTCGADQKGALRLNASADGLEMCDGAGAWAAYAGSGGGSGGGVESIASGVAYRDTVYTPAALSTWYDIPLNGGNEALNNITHSTSVNPERMTVDEDGAYFVGYKTTWTNGTAGGATGYIRIAVNGTAVSASTTLQAIPNNNYNNSLGGTSVLDLSAGDYVTVQVRHNTAAGYFNNTSLSLVKAGGGSGGVSGSGADISFDVIGATQSPGASSYFTFNFDTENYDNGDSFDLSTDRFTPTVAGKYLLNYSAASSGSGGDGHTVAFSVFKNGVEVNGESDRRSVFANVSVNGSTIVDMNGTTDYIEFNCFYESGGCSASATGILLNSGGGSGGGVTQTGGAGASAFRARIELVDARTIAATTATITNFSNEVFDKGSEFNSTTGVFTANDAGQYIFTANVHANTSATNYYAQLMKNGSELVTYGSRYQVNPGIGPMSVLSSVVDLDAGDTIELQAVSDASGSSLIVNFSGARLDSEVSGGGGADTLSGLSCTDGQVPAWDNATSAWACADGGVGGSGALSSYGHAVKTSSVSVPSGGTAVIVENYDSVVQEGSDFNAVTGLIQPTEPGIYTVAADIYGAAADNVLLLICKKGTEAVCTRSTTVIHAGAGYYAQTTNVVYLDGDTDYVDVSIQGYGGSTEVLTTTQLRWSKVSGSAGSGADTLSGLSCTDGQVPVWDNATSAWECGAGGGGSTGGETKGLYARSNSTQSIPSTTPTALNDMSIIERNDFGSGAWDNETFTVPVGESGWYQINAGMHLAVCGATDVTIEVKINGGTKFHGESRDSAACTDRANASGSIYLDESDEVSISIYQISGSAKVMGGLTSLSLVKTTGADTLSGLSCTDGQVPVWDNATSAWECGAGGVGSTGGETKGLYARSNSTQSIPSTTFTALNDMSIIERNDFGGGAWDNETFTVPAGESGWYQINAGMHLAVCGATDVAIEVKINGGTKFHGESRHSGGCADRATASGSIYLDESDEVNFTVYQVSGSAKVMGGLTSLSLVKTTGGGSISGTGTGTGSVAGDWGFKEGPTALAADYKNTWDHGGGNGDSIDCTTNANGCIIESAGTYDVRCTQRVNATAIGFVAIGLDGDRTVLENRTDAMWEHSHAVGNATVTEASFIGTLSENDLVTCGALSSGTSSLTYGSNGYMGTMKIIRLDAPVSVSGGGVGGGATPAVESAFTVVKTALQTLSAGDVIGWDLALTNIGGDFDLATDRYIAPKDGTYYFSYEILGQNNTNGSNYRVYKNGVNTTIASYGGGNGSFIYRQSDASFILTLNEGDYIDVRAADAQTPYGDATIQHTKFSGYKLNGGGSGADTLSGLSCTDGQVPAWDNATSAWACADGGVGGGGIAEDVSFYVHRNGASQTVTNSSVTLIDWTTKTTDSNNDFDLATNRFTPSVAGTYIFYLSAYCTDATVQCSGRIYKNGTLLSAGSVTREQLVGNSTAIIDMNGTTDYVEGYVYNEGGTNMDGDPHHTLFQGVLVSGGSDDLGDHTATQGVLFHKVTGASAPTK